jgi:hypothetical protein
MALTATRKIYKCFLCGLMKKGHKCTQTDKKLIVKNDKTDVRKSIEERLKNRIKKIDTIQDDNTPSEQVQNKIKSNLEIHEIENNMLKLQKKITELQNEIINKDKQILLRDNLVMSYFCKVGTK